MADASPAPGRGVRDLAVGTVLALAAIGVSWALSGAAGSAGLPRTDDWAFGRVALDLHRSGHVHLVGWGEMSLVGLAAWAQPWLWAFGDHMWALDLAAGALVGAGLVAAYLLARRVLRPSGAALVVASVGLFPGFLRDASAFMTDGPAFGAQVLCLLAGVAAMESAGRRRLLLGWACVALGVFAFTIRELAIAAPVAVLAAEFGTQRQARRSVAVRGAVLAGACGAFSLWHHGLAGGQSWFGHPPLLTGAAYVVAAGLTAALGLLPALVWSAPRWWRATHRLARGAGMVAGAVATGVLPLYAHRNQVPTNWFVGDYLGRLGINGNKIVLGVRPTLVPRVPWVLLEVVAVAAFAVVCGLVAEAAVAWISRARRRATTASPAGATVHALRWFVVLTGVGLVVAAALNGVLFDRYLWPLVFAGAVLLLTYPTAPVPALSTAPVAAGSAVPVPAGGGRGDRRWRVAAVGTVAGLGVLSLAVTANSDAFDAARWHAGEHLVAGGVPAGLVDAGFEWVGAHTDAVASLHDATYAPGRSWWVSMFRLPTMCAVVAASPISPPGYRAAGTVTWRPLLVTGSASLTLYRRAGPGCG